MPDAPVSAAQDSSRTIALVQARRWLRIERRGGLGAAALIAGIFAVTAWSLSYDYYPKRDETFYFDEANWIAEHGGAFGFLAACFRGEYPFHNRNPALPLLVSPGMERSLSAVRPARLVAVVLSALGLLAIYLLARRRLGAPSALALTAVLAASTPWLLTAPEITAEPLIFAAIFAGWLACSMQWRVPGGWLGAGLLVAAAWWIKASALLLALSGAAALGACLLYTVARRQRPSRLEGTAAARGAGLFAAGFVLLAAPLLWDRFLQKGSPFYSDAGACLWIDDWDQHRLLFQGLRAFNFRTWFQTHTLGDAAQRLITGGLQQLDLAAQYFDPMRRDLDAATPGQVYLLGGAALLLAAWGWWTLRGLWTRVYTLAFLACAWAMMAWYVHTPAVRLSAILGPVVAFLALRGAADLVRRRRRKFPQRFPAFRRARLRAALLLAAALYGTVLPAALWLRPSAVKAPTGAVPAPPGFLPLAEWMKTVAVPQQALCFQTPLLYPNYQVQWLAGHDELWLDVPPLPDFEAFQAYAAKRNARYLIVEADSLAGRENLFGEYFTATKLPEPYQAYRRLNILKPPPGWRIARADVAPLYSWVILEREAAE